jgi:2-polyprenyl-3-methyl-5-hydroxy-6-metoxy-1,4-benzoquinol methylase
MARIYDDSYFLDRTRVSEEFIEGRCTLHDVMIEGILRRLGKPSPGDRLLDIGCGVGKLLLRARELGWEVEGIEPSAYASAHARDSLGLNVRTGVFRVGEFPEAAFRAIVLLDVVEHFYDPLPMLREIHKLLRPDGCCLLTTPNVSGLSRWLFGGRNYALDATLEGVGHVTFFSVSTLAAMLRAAGFSQTNAWTGEIYLKNFTDLIRKGRPAADLHRKARVALRPRWWTVAAYHTANRLLALTHLGDQITMLAYRR